MQQAGGGRGHDRLEEEPGSDAERQAASGQAAEAREHTRPKLLQLAVILCPRAEERQPGCPAEGRDGDHLRGQHERVGNGLMLLQQPLVDKAK